LFRLARTLTDPTTSTAILIFASAHIDHWMLRSPVRIPEDLAQTQTFGHNSISLRWFSTLAANLTFASPLSVLPTLSTTAHALARKTSERCIPGAHFPIHADCCGRVRQNSGRESQLCRPSRLIPVAGRGDGSAKLWQHTAAYGLKMCPLGHGNFGGPVRKRTIKHDKAEYHPLAFGSSLWMLSGHLGPGVYRNDARPSRLGGLASTAEAT
jgi:hypothetical protein